MIIDIKNLEKLERGILNKYKLVLGEDNKPMIDMETNLEEIYSSSVILNYLKLKNQKIDIYKNKNNEIVALKINKEDGNKNNIQSFLYKKEALAKILFLLLEIENAGFNLSFNSFLEKDKILNGSKIKKSDLEEYIFSDNKGLFIFLEKKNKKSINEFMLSPFLWHVLNVFKEKMRFKEELEEEGLEEYVVE